MNVIYNPLLCKIYTNIANKHPDWSGKRVLWTTLWIAKKRKIIGRNKQQ